MRDYEAKRAKRAEGLGLRELAHGHNIRLKSKIDAMTALSYKILLRKEDDETYTVIVPSLPGCLTFGHNVEEPWRWQKRP